MDKLLHKTCFHTSLHWQWTKILQRNITRNETAIRNFFYSHLIGFSDYELRNGDSRIMGTHSVLHPTAEQGLSLPELKYIFKKSFIFV